ncbi:PfkB domain-containing protein [Alicyclobacillus hesperidum URH17-3-68]|uniref:ribokinase n=1 Tax=Alicyclobacillus hesperidum TaxID=89784 RepID=UPI000281B60D|nr:ribokinase [Alicyclobacillus hesperidum]EJY55729.1 PfkB domain-containing protein [Alicyclobacillus hesperidum URH17-3-68]
MRIAVVGSINMDVMASVDQLPSPGETVVARGVQYSPGGKGANQAVAAARSGADVWMIGATGRDPFAQAARDSLASAGVHIGHVADKPGATGMALIEVGADGENHIVLAAGANGLLEPADVARADSILTSCDMLLLQNEVPWAANQEALRIAKAAGARVLYNPAPMRNLTGEALRGVDVLVMNETEAAALIGTVPQGLDGDWSVLDSLAGIGIAIVVVTLGAQGLVCWQRGGLIRLPAFPVRAIDTTAAGDTFIGAFAAAFDERNLVRALRFGAAAAALAVTRPGAQAAVPMYSEIERMLETDGGEFK